MTYSQRLSGGASLSDIIHLEHQIGMTEDELHVAAEELKQQEQEMVRLSLMIREKDGAGRIAEQAIQEKLDQIRTHMEVLSSRLAELEEALEKLVD